MKKVVLTFLLLLPMIALGSGRKLTLKIDGMTCPACAASVESHLNKLDGVDSVDISLRKNEATVTIKDGRSVKAAILEKAIRDAGFKLISLSSE